MAHLAHQQGTVELLIRAELSLAVAGILVSAAGFAATLWQVRKTRSAVEASELSARAALAALSQRVTVAELAEMRAGVKSIQTALRGGRLESALLFTQSVLDQLHTLRSRQGFNSDQKLVDIQAIVVRLAKLRDQLESQIAAQRPIVSVPRANNALAEIGSRLAEWGEELRFSAESEEA